MRTLLIVLVNLALPFLLHTLWVLVRQWLKNKNKPQPKIIDVTPVKKTPVIPLLLVGILLLGGSLITLRFMEHDTAPTPWQPANPAASVDY